MFLDRLDQLTLVDRLGDVALGALAQAPYAVRFLVLGGDQDDRDMTGGLLARDRARGLEPVQVGHHHVHQDQVRDVLLGRIHTLLTILSGDHFVPLPLDDALEHQELRRRIVHDQDPSHSYPAVKPVSSVRFYPYAGMRGQVVSTLRNLAGCRSCAGLTVHQSPADTSAEAPTRTSVRPSAPPAINLSNTCGNCSSVASPVTMRSRWRGRHSCASRCHRSARTG